MVELLGLPSGGQVCQIGGSGPDRNASVVSFPREGDLIPTPYYWSVAAKSWSELPILPGCEIGTALDASPLTNEIVGFCTTDAPSFDQIGCIWYGDSLHRLLDLVPNADIDATLELLRALPGVGEWTAQYIAMRALAWPDAFPHTDLGVMKALGTKDAKRVLAAGEAWRPWRAYAVMHLWNSLAKDRP